MASQQNNAPVIAVVAAASAGIAFGCMGTASQVVMRQGFSLGQVVTAQFLVATLVLGALTLARFRQLPGKRDAARLLAVGLLQPLSALLLYSGIDHLTVGPAVAIQFQYVWLTIAIQSAVERTLPPRRIIVAAIVIIGGTLLASGVAETVAGGQPAFSLEGILLSAGCAVSYSFFLYFNGKVATDVHPVPRSFLLCLSGAVLTSAVFPGLYAEPVETLSALAPGAIVLGLLASVPVLCLSYAAKRLSGGLVAILTSMELPAAVITGVAILGDPTSPVKIMGVAAILAGIVISEADSLFGRRRKPEQANRDQAKTAASN